MTSTSDRSSTRPDRALEHVFRAEWGRLLSLLISRTRRLDLAEDALSEAFARASERWPGEGSPANPAGWLYATAYRKVVGRLRAEATAGRKAPLLAVRPGWVPPDESQVELPDDRLQLILLCCHPALPSESQSALALRLVIGTPTEQIARLFLVPPATMTARLTRAKKKIVIAGIPIGASLEEELRTRLDEVCRTIYLAFTAGYTPGPGPDLLRADLAGEAVRLAAILHHLVPDAAQVKATLALLVLQHSRRDARQRHGRLVPLVDQDRSMWHHDEIRAGLGLAAGLQPAEGYAEELRLQAFIAAEHARAPTAATTDWTAIAGHYAALEARTGSAIVRLNRVVAVAEAHGPRAGLTLLAGLDDVLHDNHRVAAVRAELAQRVGDHDLARTSYRNEGAAGIRTSWATTPSDRTLGRPTVFLWTAPAALDSPCRLGGEAAFQREIASRRQLLGRSAGVERRLGALLSSENGLG
jgi:RNA polymerase sigma-70 factor, ECF subfamily